MGEDICDTNQQRIFRTYTELLLLKKKNNPTEK